MRETGMAAVFLGPGKGITFHKCDVPTPVGSAVLVRVTACTICGSDRHSFQGRRATPLPSILGHEIIGQIVELGPEAHRRDWNGAELKVGDRITWGLVVSCGSCFFCRHNLSQKCTALKKYGHEPWTVDRGFNGGLADYCLLYPNTHIFHLPDDLADEVACPASCATATVAAALQAAGNVGGCRSLVFGAGMLGITSVAWLKERGAIEVLVCDQLTDRLELAEEFGATRCASPNDLAAQVALATEGTGVDLVLEMSGAIESVAAGLANLRVGGTMVLVGSVFPTPPVAFEPETIVRRCLRLQGVHNYAPAHLAQAISFLRSQPGGRFAPLVSEWLPLSQAQRALSEQPPMPALRTGVRPS